MISFIKGRILDINKNILLIENNGIGYEVQYLQKAGSPAFEPGDNISLYILSFIRDDLITFYGFSDPSDKHLAKRLIKIPGIGMKNAMNILSNINQANLLESIQNNNIAQIQNIPGIGKKTAQRIITELREDIPRLKGQLAINLSDDDSYEKVSTGLLNLGFRQELIQEVLHMLSRETQSRDVAFLIKRSLSIIANMRK